MQSAETPEALPDPKVPNLKQPKQAMGLAEWGFLLGLVFYVLTRFVALDEFPIYFFSDEAIQSMSAYDLLQRGFRDVNGELLPVYFENGGQYNLSFSVWLQVLTAWLPRSIWTTRGLPALISLVFPLSVGLSLKKHFSKSTWWLAPWLICAIPAWFLHSRSAFETSLGTSMFSLFVYFYLQYRLNHRGFLPLALIFGALSFYSYSPLQLVVAAMGLAFLISDWSYHFKSKRTILLGLTVLLLAAAPFVHFRLTHANALQTHLSLLKSYWLDDISLMQKLSKFGFNWLKGLDPAYWFFYNRSDLMRHQIKNIGHLPWLFLPFTFAGLCLAFKNWRKSEYRWVLLSLLITPMGAALVAPSITRLLVMIVPMAYLSLLGVDFLLSTLSAHSKVKFLPALITAAFLGTFGCWLSIHSIKQGGLWYEDYGLYGMQWGGKQISQEIREFQVEYADKQLILSPSWANNTDIIMRYFLGDPLPIEIGTLEAYALYPLELDKSKVFIMTADEYEWIPQAGKFQNVEVLHRLNWPNGKAGFLFVSLEYVDEIHEIFKQEFEERQKPQKDTLMLLGQEVQISHALLDIGTIADAFDGNALTLVRGFEANPLSIEITFPEPVQLSGVSALIGSPPTRLTVKIWLNQSETQLFFSAEDPGGEVVHPLEIDFGASYSVRQLSLSVQNLNEDKPAHVHIWEIDLR